MLPVDTTVEQDINRILHVSSLLAESNQFINAMYRLLVILGDYGIIIVKLE